MKPGKGCQCKLSTHRNVDFFSLTCTELKFAWQDLAASMDEGDVAKFTDAVKEFDSLTRLVLSIGNFSAFSFIVPGRCLFQLA
jgi:hypothetical protein